MKRAGVPIGIGSRVPYDGEIVEIVEVDAKDGSAEAITKDLRSGSVRRIALSELMYSDGACVLGDDDLAPEYVDYVGEPAGVLWGNASEDERRTARYRAAHVREVLTGYKSGSAITTGTGEPRAKYLPSRPKGERMEAKAEELHRGKRTIERWVANFVRFGEAGLLPAKSLSVNKPAKFEVFERTARDIMIEHTDLSRPTKNHVIAHAFARIRAAYGEGCVPLPSYATAYRCLTELDRRHQLFCGSSKRNRDIAARSLEVYGKLHPSRPGEYLLMDTTPLDVFAMDPQTLRWVGVDLTVALDWYSRCIVGLRLTPTAKAIDAALVLYQCFRPPRAGCDWPAEAVWPPHGVPRSVLVEHDALSADSACAATPAVAVDTIVVDHGKIYVGEVLTSACRQMGISIQPARTGQGRDKGPVERVFRTIRQGFLQELPGYKGPDLYSRGLSPEKEAYYFIDELEQLLLEWVACVYHLKSHDGVGESGLWALGMSPVQMFAHGIAKAGYLEMPRDPNLAFHFLQVRWCTVQHYGVQVDKRIYRATVLVDYIKDKSPYTEHNGRWPIHVNPDDIRQVYFFDLKHTRRWHALVWTEAAVLKGAMNEDGLLFARQLAAANHRVFDDRLALAELLDRRGLTQGRTPAERKAALRLCREQASVLEVDLAAALDVTQLATASRVLVS